MNKLWCEKQFEDDDDILCLAHLHENRISVCPYNNATKRSEAEYPCSDYMPVKEAQNEEN